MGRLCGRKVQIALMRTRKAGRGDNTFRRASPRPDRIGPQPGVYHKLTSKPAAVESGEALNRPHYAAAFLCLNRPGSQRQGFTIFNLPLQARPRDSQPGAFYLFADVIEARIVKSRVRSLLIHFAIRYSRFRAGTICCAR